MANYTSRVFGMLERKGPRPVSIEEMHEAVLDQAAVDDRNVLQAIRERDFPRFVRITETTFKQAAREAARHTKLHGRAAEVLGSDDEARRWVREPAVALKQQRPIDLVATEEGSQLVLDYLDKIEHGR